MELNCYNIQDSVSVALDKEMIQKIANEYIKMAKGLRQKNYVSSLRNEFKSYLNIDEKSKGTNEDLNEITELNKAIVEASKQIGMYQPLKQNGNPIFKQEGWFTYQSWHLENDKKYGENEISHRFYINVSPKFIPDFMGGLIEEYSDLDIPYYFKVNANAQLGQKDSIVIYSSTEHLDATLNALQNLENKHPELIEQCNEPHLFVGNINNWVGYASESKIIKDSYTGIMTTASLESFKKTIYDCIEQNPKLVVPYENQYLKLVDYFNEKLLDEEGKTYDQVMKDRRNYAIRMAHLLSVLPSIDNTFYDKLCDNFKTIVDERYHINPNNICFNKEVSKEIYYHNNKKVATAQEFKSSIQELKSLKVEVQSNGKEHLIREKEDLKKARDMYVKMMREPNRPNFTTYPDGTRANDRELPEDNKGIRR